MVDSGGSVPCWTNSAGTEVMTVKVAAWASSTSPSSSPRNICPPSMGCLSSHMADRERSATSRSLALSFLVGLVHQLHRPLDAQADHVGPLGGGVVDGLGELDALALQFPLPLQPRLLLSRSRPAMMLTAAETAYSATTR